MMNAEPILNVGEIISDVFARLSSGQQAVPK
jgi:hypothetical protein